ncbi:MAG: outer membrane lipoprotein-sorting protein [Myxococcales bacterium]
MVRTYTVAELGERGGRMLPVRATMQNAKTGSRTELVLESVDAQPPADEAFTERALERG